MRYSSAEPDGGNLRRLPAIERGRMSYYQVRPHHAVLWTDFPDLSLNRLADEFDQASTRLQWDQMEWQPAQRSFQYTLRLALRYGIATPQGIVIGGLDMVPLTHLEELLGLRSRRQSELPGQDLMEALIPGWKKHGDDLDDRVEASLRASQAAARRELDEALGINPKPGLTVHWTRTLGGTLPEPP